MNAVKSLRRRKGMQQKELAIAVGVSQATVSEWEHGKKDPSGERITKLMKIFGVSAAELLCEEEPSQSKAASSIRVPIYGRIPAGIPFDMIVDIEDYEEIPSDMARGGKEFFALRVKGDSMMPKYENGDIIILRATPVCENGQDCAVRVNGNDATFKRVYKTNDGGIVLQPLNPAYEPITFTRNQWESEYVSVLGVVVELRRKI